MILSSMSKGDPYGVLVVSCPCLSSYFGDYGVRVFGVPLFDYRSVCSFLSGFGFGGGVIPGVDI